MEDDAGANAVGIVIAENDYPLVIFIASTILGKYGFFHVQYQQRVIHIIAVFRIKKFFRQRKARFHAPMIKELSWHFRTYRLAPRRPSGTFSLKSIVS